MISQSVDVKAPTVGRTRAYFNDAYWYLEKEEASSIFISVYDIKPVN